MRAGSNVPMARLAWFTPLPPTPSGIAAYSADLLPLVGRHHCVHAFVEPSPPGAQAAAQALPGSAGLAVLPAHEVAWRHLRAPYDLTVYQLGNASCHDFIWPHLARYPGLVVLHDGQLHHARARRLLTHGRFDDYRAEFRYNHPDAPPDVAELVIAALAGSTYYFYPMLRWVLRSARLVAVHSPGLARDLREAYPGVELHTVRHGMGDPAGEHVTAAGRRLRRGLGIPDAAVLFGAFGLVTPEKRISAALRGLASLAADHPEAHLLLAGGTAAHYDAVAEARALGVEERVHVTGYVADGDLPAWVGAADVCLCLRWPTGGETSGTWLRAIAAGKPTVVTDLAHAAQTPSLDPTTWAVLPPTLPRPGTPPEPVSVSIDILDENRRLALAMRRLASDAGLRGDLGRAARHYWTLHHTMTSAVDDYLRVIDRALERPVEVLRDVPAHLLPDPLERARAVAAEMGAGVDVLHLTAITPDDTLDCPNRGRSAS